MIYIIMVRQDSAADTPRALQLGAWPVGLALSRVQARYVWSCSASTSDASNVDRCCAEGGMLHGLDAKRRYT